MPTAGATAKLPSPLDRTGLPPALDRREPPSPLDRDPARGALLRRAEAVVAEAWAAQDAELDAEIAALETGGVLTVPAEEEHPGQALDPDGVPPHRLLEWLADMSASSFDECLATTADATGPNMPRTGGRDRVRDRAVGFVQGGGADLLSPGAALAGFAEDAHHAGLSRLTEDELAGVIRAGRRLSSWASALELAAVSDLMRRREQQEAAGHPHAAEHVDAEIAALLTLTGRGAGRVLDLAMALRRLPLTTRALAAGVIDVHRAAVIADETTGLDDDHAAAVEDHVLVRAPGQTTSQVRAAARRAVLAADPRAARKRQEQAQREARVERWDEHAGTAALAGRDLPPAAVIAADQHISALARGLRTAGLVGTADQLRAQVFLALLSGVSAASLLRTGQYQPDPSASDYGNSPDPGTPGHPRMAGDPGMRHEPGMRPDPGTRHGAGMPGGPVTGGGPGSPNWPATATGPGPRAAASASATADWPGIPAVAGMVNLTMPLSAWLGILNSPGEVTGFGPLTADDSRHLGTAMMAHPHTRWCVTLTSADGRPVAHGCARPAHGPPPPVNDSPPPVPGPPPPVPGPPPPMHSPPPPVDSPPPPVPGPAPPARGSTPSEHRPDLPERHLDWSEHPPDLPEHRPGCWSEHGSIPPGHGSDSPGLGHEPAARHPAPSGSGTAATAESARRTGSVRGGARVAAWLASVPMRWFESTECTHQRQSAAYRPPPALRHLIGVRQQVCAFPGCRRPASQCDLDHTTPFQRGGLTCECNIAPLCRKHHEAKQAPGWHLEHLRPGVLTWTTPSGRSYTTEPTVYPG